MLKSNFFKKFKSKRVKYTICIIAAAAALFSISFNIGERIYVKNHPEMDRSVFGISKEEPVSINSEVIIYEDMKNMASYIMEAKINNETNINISKEKLQSLRIIVNKMGYSDRTYITSVLDRWRDGNFSLITDEHNYFYLRLKDYANN